MTKDQEQDFQRHMENTVEYFAKVEAAGDTPWFDDPEKLARLEPRCPGISGLRGLDARRALFAVRYTRPAHTPWWDPRLPEAYADTTTDHTEEYQAA